MGPFLTRRGFLKQTASAAGAGVLAGLPRSARSEPVGAHDDIRLAIVGFNGHGTGGHLKPYLSMPGVRVVALCDPDRRVLEKGVRIVGEKTPNVRTHTDVRELLERDDIDAISGATPNHWHALSTVWACQAGKHVCVEKPVSHNIWEGRKMVEAAEKYGRLVQADLDRRSSASMEQAVDYLRSGQLGKILFVHGWVYKRRKSMGKVDVAGTVPDAVDYDLWCGPAPTVPLPRKRLHYDWHWQWDYGCGEIGNNGAHHLDICRWMLGENGLPKSVVSFGGRYGYDDDGQTPNTQIAFYDYPTAPILFEVRGLPRKSGSNLMDRFRATSRKGTRIRGGHESGSPNVGSLVVCEGGYVDLKHFAVFDRDGNEIQRFSGGGPKTIEHFIRAVRSGKPSDLRTTILDGHLSASLCHMGNISYRVGKEASVEQVKEVIEKDEQVRDAFERMREHLSANGVSLDKQGVTLGPRLEMDPATERFTGDFSQQANALVKREYREPFVIREQV